MINREIVYERNLTGSFMKIAAGIHAGLDEKLMLRRKLPGLLAVEKAYMDGEGQYWYNISGKQSLDMYCRVKEVDIFFIEKLIMSICSEMEILEWNLIQTNCLMLDPELIFITNSNQEIIFTVYPGGSGTIETEFQQLMEFLLTKVDHKDTQAVKAAYGIYEKTLLDGYSITDIRDEIVRTRQNEGKKAAVEESGGNGMEKVWREENNQPVVPERKYEDYPDKKRKDETVKRANRKKKGEKKKEGKKKEQKEWIRKLKKLLIEIGLLEEEETEKQVYESYHGSRECLQDTRKLSKSAVVYPEEVIKTVAQPEYRPTVCLNSMTGKTRGMLLYQGAESYEDICVTKKMTRIGYGPDADIQIQADTISQLHARIDRDGETYYIEDLNSTNGTFVNDEPLAYKERRKLNSNDMIRFADVRYRFC